MADQYAQSILALYSVRCWLWCMAWKHPRKFIRPAVRRAYDEEGSRSGWKIEMDTECGWLMLIHLMFYTLIVYIPSFHTHIFSFTNIHTLSPPQALTNNLSFSLQVMCAYQIKMKHSGNFLGTKQQRCLPLFFFFFFPIPAVYISWSFHPSLNSSVWCTCRCWFYPAYYWRVVTIICWTQSGHDPDVCFSHSVYIYIYWQV